MSSPSQSIVRAADRTFEVVDSRGRKLVCRRLRAFEQARVFAAAGADNAENQPFMGLAIAAACVSSIDGVPRQLPMNSRDIFTSLEMVDDEGLQAIQEHIAATQADGREASGEGYAKN